MEKIWKKVGRQENTGKDSSSSSKRISSHFQKAQSGAHHSVSSRDHDFSINKSKLQGSECFDISQDSLSKAPKKKTHFEQQSKGRESVNIQFVGQEDSVNDERRRSQINLKGYKSKDFSQQEIEKESYMDSGLKRSHSVQTQIIPPRMKQSSSIINQNSAQQVSNNSQNPIKLSSQSNDFLKTISENQIGQVNVIQPDYTIELVNEFEGNNMVKNSKFVQSEGSSKSSSFKKSKDSKVIEHVEIKDLQNVPIKPIDIPTSLEYSSHRNETPQKNNYYSQRIQKKSTPKQPVQIGKEVIQTNLKDSSQSCEQVHIIDFDEMNNSEGNKNRFAKDKSGITVRIKSGSRQKESIFFQIGDNMNQSDSFLQRRNLKKGQVLYDDVNQLKSSTKMKAQQKILPQNQSLNNDRQMQKTDEINQLQKPSQQKSYLSSRSSRFEQLKKSFTQVEERHENNSQQIQEQQQVQQIIDLQGSNYERNIHELQSPFRFGRHQKHSSDSIQGKSLVPSLINSENLIKQANTSVPLLKTEPEINELKQSRLSDSQIDKNIVKKKIQLKQHSNELWEFPVSEVQSKSKIQSNQHENQCQQEPESSPWQYIRHNRQLQEGEYFKRNTTEEEQESDQQRLEQKKSFLDFVPETKQGLPPPLSDYFSSKQHKNLQEIVPIQQMRQQEEASSPFIRYSVHNITTTNCKPEDYFKSAPSIQQKLSRVQQQIEFSYQNFINLVEQRRQLKSQMVVYAKDLIAKDERIHELQLEVQTLKTGCEALRCEIETVQHEKDELMFEKEMVKSHSELGRVYDDMERKDKIISQKAKENDQLKGKIEILNVQITLLVKQLKQRQLKATLRQQSKTQLGSDKLLTNSKPYNNSNSITGCFGQTPLNSQPNLTSSNKQTKSKSSSIKILNGIPTLSQQNLGSQIQFSSGQNLQNLNLSIQLNYPQTKRLLINRRQHLQQLQQYIFDIEQKIVCGEIEYQQRLSRALMMNEVRIKEKYSNQIEDIKQELQIVKIKYDKLKGWVKKAQKQKITKKQTQSPIKQQQKSGFQQMMKNVSDFQQLFSLFNQFNQMNNQRQDPSPTVVTGSGKHSLYDTGQLRDKQMALRRKEEDFQRISRDIETQWDLIQREKRRCLSPQNYQNVQQPIVQQSVPIYPYPQPIQQPNIYISSAHRNSHPYNDYNVSNLNNQFNTNKFSSQVQQMPQFQSSPQIQQSRSQRQLPYQSNQNFYRSKSPQTARRFNSEFEFNSHDSGKGLNTMGRSLSPDLHYNYREKKARVHFQESGVRKYEFRKGNNIFDDPKDISFISSKLTKLRNDIDMELKSIK